jgi:hypothetical protein
MVQGDVGTSIERRDGADESAFLQFGISEEEEPETDKSHLRYSADLGDFIISANIAVVRKAAP